MNNKIKNTTLALHSSSKEFMVIHQNILLVDDDLEDQEIFLEAMREISRNISCVAMKDAKIALEKLHNHDFEADLIFLDLNMPIMGGKQFLEEIKNDKSLKHIPVIILSTTSQAKTIEKVKQLGAAAFITKPNTFNGLVERLKVYI
ncbi:response regulator [soil metagenome]